MHRPCVRCQGNAGFWVRNIGGQVRRPWCLKCIDRYLNRSTVKITIMKEAM